MARLNAYISIGNSDDKLTQQRWAAFIDATREFLTGNRGMALGGRPWQIHGEWYSRPDHPWQNANWCVEINDVDQRYLYQQMAEHARLYDQDSIAVAIGQPVFCGPAGDLNKAELTSDVTVLMHRDTTPPGMQLVKEPTLARLIERTLSVGPDEGLNEQETDDLLAWWESYDYPKGEPEAGD